MPSKHRISCFLGLLFATGCGIGDVSEQGPATSDSGVLVDANLADAQLEDPNCVPAAAPNGNGKHNAGANCISQNCHDGLGAPPKWTLAGTLYTDAAGAAIAAGATMIFTDANNQEIRLVTASNGNFYTGDPIAFPITVKSSRCPNSLSMSEPIAETMGGCNQAGCHDPAKRIYLPE